MEKIRQNHLFRALRVDKLTISVLESVLLAYLRGQIDEIPIWRMLRSAEAELKDRTTTGLSNPDKLVGFQGSFTTPVAMLFANHGLHLEIQLDSNHVIGKQHHAGVKDVYMESAMTTIQDCDRIFVFHKGTLAEEGTHDSLIAADGIYAKLVELQRRERELGISIYPPAPSPKNDVLVLK